MRGTPARVVALLIAAGLSCAALVALGLWQVERRAWKLALIAQVERRVTAAPVAAPGPEQWRRITAERDGYRHVVATGRYRDDDTTFVQAVTGRGPGFWAITPFVTARGFVILVNRGFVARRGPVLPDSTARVTGLLRLSEPGGGFLRRNDPARDRWYSRDVSAIARARGIGAAAPYFIDADAGPAGAEPVGGLTVVRFSNNHLVYALTWFTLAAMVAGAGAMVWCDRRPWP